jgi:hypothetical protein
VPYLTLAQALEFLLQETLWLSSLSFNSV